MKNYPKDFPNPTIEGYGISVDMGITRTVFDTGRARQRRRYKTMPQVFSFNFVVPIHQLELWQIWVNKFAYSYFKMNATSYLTGYENDKFCSEHKVRFISDLSLTPATPEHMRISVAAEMIALSEASLPAHFTGDWIIAGDPATPSPEWAIAMNPDLASPSTDWTNPGSPSSPAAIV